MKTINQMTIEELREELRKQTFLAEYYKERYDYSAQVVGQKCYEVQTLKDRVDVLLRVIEQSVVNQK